MNSRSTKIGRNVLLDLREWHDWNGMALCGVSKLLKSGEGFTVSEIQDPLGKTSYGLKPRTNPPIYTG
jgi:hypothetical protein